MDTEQQVRFDFLEEAEDYFDNLESLLIDLDAQGAEPELLDTAMRAAHSLKGGAAMMRFTALSKTAHRLEDFLKILRVRRDNSLADKEVTTLLLQGVDCLRDISSLHQYGDAVEEVWLAENTNPVFDALQGKLGDLSEEDEDSLLAEEEQVDVSTLIFQSGVEDCLESFQTQIDILEPDQLKIELALQAEQLAEFGQMSQIEPFVQLCHSVQRQLAVVSIDGVRDLAHESLKLWERSHALVLVGKTDNLPTQLKSESNQPALDSVDIHGELPNINDVVDSFELDAIQQFTARELAIESSTSLDSALDLDQLQVDAAFELKDLENLTASESVNLDLKQTEDIPESWLENLGEFDPDTEEKTDLDEIFASDSIDNASALAAENIEAERESLDFAHTDAVVEIPNPAMDLDIFTADAAELSDLGEIFELDSLENASVIETESLETATFAPAQADAVAETPAPALDLDAFAADAAELLDLGEVFAAVDDSDSVAEQDNKSAAVVKSVAKTDSPQPKKEKGRMVRIPAEQLANLNNLSSKLILERNAAILRLNQLQNFVGLTRERMRRLEKSSNQLRKLYDWASLEGMVPTTQAEPVIANVAWQPASSLPTEEKFDALEMDRYTDLHLLSQEQMETIVQLQEVTADMDLGVREMSQVIRDFSYTTRDLQQNVTRSQMRPFSELVSRFPRLIRDLSGKHNKQVELKIEGETTYIDRQALELLSDPLTHLLRNAFDHGLEDTPSRLAAGKPAVGTIVLRAVQQGNQTIITIADDGGGINTVKIRDRLTKMGLSQREVENISETDVVDAIFEPGFSTAEQVTELSGRGVGMDVVRSNIKQIRGDIQVKTELGKGTTFTIAVPLSLLVLRVVLVESAGLVFAIPVQSIKEITKFEQDLVIQNDQGETMAWGNLSISLVRLEQQLKFRRPSRPFEMDGIAKIQAPTVLMFEDNDRLTGIYLDKYWNEQEVAIRPVQTSISLFPGFTGSTVLGDGRVIPLIEPNALVRGLAKQSAQSAPSLTSLSKIADVFGSSHSDSQASTVLIIDDSVNVRRYLAGILERNNYRVEEAKDGRDAVDKLMGGLQVQAMICDVEMPRLDGYGVLSEVKSEPSLEHIPIAMLTSRSNDKHRKLAMKLGASAYFSKPFNEQEMLETLASLIAQ